MSDLAVNVYRKRRKIDPRRVNWNSYNEIVETDFNTYAEKIKTLSNDPLLHNLDDAVTSISKSLYNAASINTHRQETDVIVPVLHDPILMAADESWSTYLQGNSDLTDNQELRTQAVEYLKSAATKSEREGWATVLSSDSKQIWSKINWKGSLTSRDNIKKPELTNLCAHFKSKSKSLDNSTLLCEVTSSTYVHELDHVTFDEIKSAQTVERR